LHLLFLLSSSKGICCCLSRHASPLAGESAVVFAFASG
jgi:hypothetical protein